MTSELRVDNLKGSTTGGSINVLGEGTSATTNLQQGLAKSWINFNGQSTIATRDSFNVSNNTDNGTGNYTVTFSNNMANANYMINTTGEQLSGFDSIVANKDYGTAYTTSESKIAVTQGSSRADPVYANFSTHGDLA